MSEKTYSQAVRAYARGLWLGVFTYQQFMEGMLFTIKRSLEKAWSEGAAACGVKPDEYTPAEITALKVLIVRQYSYLDRLASFIEQNRRGVGLLRTVMFRVGMWSTRYREAYDLGMAHACENLKLAWVLGPPGTEHCKSCLKLSGQVRRASYWVSANIYPKHISLACKGFFCKCRLIKTDKPLSRGRLPKIP